MHLRELDGYTLQVLPGALNRGMMNGERRLLEISEQDRNSLGEYERGRQSIVWMIAQLRRN
ncbi:hypothetical protein [Alicyclobacillus pomorum]|jgi:hypothetical protein|uniref:hypothetical protein n=1 Tax=Alicyclobacillus pomorum TaxID=204470 RepID=UPI00047C82EA|nr:hypothetical protein [Alicyclobacillus pomorum]